MFLANIIILAHAIIPHHHGADTVVNSHYHNRELGDKQCDTSGMHEHNHNEPIGDEYCVLNQVFAIPQKTNSPVCNWFDNQHYSPGYNAVLNSSVLISGPPLSIITDIPGHISFIRSIFVNSSLSLRAPPTV